MLSFNHFLFTYRCGLVCLRILTSILHVAVKIPNPIKEHFNQKIRFFWASRNSIALSPKEIEKRQLTLYFKVVFFLSSMGWIVAIYNTSQMKIGKFDIGILTFVPSTVSSALQIRNSKNSVGINENRNGNQEFKSMCIYGRSCVLGCHIVVILNYLIGFLLALTIGSHVYVNFAIISLIGVIIWLVCAVIGWRLITRSLDNQSEESSEAKRELEDLYGFR